MLTRRRWTDRNSHRPGDLVQFDARINRMITLWYGVDVGQFGGRHKKLKYEHIALEPVMHGRYPWMVYVRSNFCNEYVLYKGKLCFVDVSSIGGDVGLNPFGDSVFITQCSAAKGIVNND